MRNAFCVLTSLLSLVVAAHTSRADSTWELSVQVSATVQAAPAQITLGWPQDKLSLPNSYTIYRKAPGATAWGAGTVLPGTATTFVDNNVTPGTLYEYQVVKNSSQYTGYGYLVAGINVPLTENRGKLLLVVDKTYATQLSGELQRLQQDLVGDGWTVVQLDVNRNDTPANVKGQIKAQYSADPANVKCVFLFGHVPVPYSGNIVPDGHTPEHQGAWPSDAYYGDMDGNWTDNSVNVTSASDSRTRNVPGDGKFDQSTFPSAIELMVGRVDLANMPGRLTWGGAATFPNELELLRNYLNKDHKYRTKQFDLPRRAVVGDYFGFRNGEAFAASGWRNFAPLFGADKITHLPDQGTWIPTLKNDAYLWAYGCGAGSYTSIGGLGNTGTYRDGVTPEMYQNDVKAVFTMLFGSWLGDWDSEDNIQRSVLALPSYGLTCAWSGRPHWYLQHMAMGEPIGFSTRLTQNNPADGLYRNQVNNCASQIHVALMGDPTLRTHVVAPPSNVRGAVSGATATLNWTPSVEAVAGYHVYKAANTNGPFTRVTSAPVTSATFTDNAAGGAANYMVRAVKLETSASGTYFNLSQGAFLNEIAASGTSTGTDSGTQTGTGTTVSNTNTTASGSTSNTSSTVTPTGLINTTAWVDDVLPAGAQAGGEGGDSWNWVTANPAPFSGSKAHQSSLSSGLHQVFFTHATDGMRVNSGDTLFAYVYLDPANPPRQLMLQWNNGDWEHRAYWGANLIGYGVNGTDNRRYMGPLPPTGKWVRLEVPASQVGLEGSVLKGLALSQFDGRATWDLAGKGTPGTETPTTPTTPGTPDSSTNNTGAGMTPSLVWVDEALPEGAQGGSEGGDNWNWVTTSPAPYAGGKAHQSALTAGMHQHFFSWARTAMPVAAGDVLFTAVYLDPANPPSQIMLQWSDGSWHHRAYWGANRIQYGTDGTASRRYMGPLPTPGQWALLQVPASQVGLEGAEISGMAFTLFDGRATWDYTGVGKPGTSSTPDNPPTTPTTPTPTNSVPTNPPVNVTSVSWVDDVLPKGAIPGADGGDSWNWVNANPAPISGSVAHQSSVSAGLHQHYFSWAEQPLKINAGEVLYAHAYVDPANPPSQLMLQWSDGSWEHRAYWGASRMSYGIEGTASRRNMGPMPAAGKWVRLEVPASQVGLEGASITGMAFSQFDGRATWDNAGKASGLLGTTPDSGTNTNTVPTTPGSGTNTNTVPTVPGTTNTTPGTVPGTNTTPGTVPGSTNSGSVNTNQLAGVSVVDYVNLELPQVGDHTLHVLTPTMLELKLINTKEQNQSAVAEWNFVDGNSQYTGPSAGAFRVTANGQNVAVTAVGFKRRPLYAPSDKYDLRIDSSLYLQLAAPISDNQVIEVTNPDGQTFTSEKNFSTKADPLRFNPAIHVNQEGYMPSYTKKAMVGYYVGSLGELAIPSSAGFKIVDAASGAQVFQGSLVQRADTGYPYSPTPYQKVYEADFTGFNTPGEYRLVVPGMGASLPFLINQGVAMSFARAYALGLYHQRCGTSTKLPHTRFTHDTCHAAPASVPADSAQFPFTWNTVANYANSINQNNPPQTAPRLTSPAAQLFPFKRTGTIDVTGGHHDAGDYSKYTINSASLVHYLMFAVDSLSGVAALDNLGIPESGDGISDVLQEAKWEADFLAKLQDTDGGFYFLVYPKDREYENNVTPEKGDAQVVWPKTTSVTAAAVAALAQCASSPKFKQAYPAVAAQYLQKAQLGWQFLTNAINKHGKSGAYQKITHYGDDFVDNDELAWAACEMYLATGDPSIQQKLMAWFDPADPATWRWGWWHMAQAWGHAVRSYAFAARSGRLSVGQLNASYLAKCEAEVIKAGDDMVTWSQQNAYGSSFPEATKRVLAAGWYFSTDQAFDVAVAYQLNAKSQYMTAMLANMNYEAGCNPVNVSYVSGLGWKRQRDVVSQWAVNDTKRLLPPSGQPTGNIFGNFGYLWFYGGILDTLCFPANGAASAPYPFYDRWGDSWNVNAEFVVLNQARSLGTLAFMAAQTPLKSQAWKGATGTIQGPTGVLPVGKPVTLTMQAPGIDLSGARIVWEARDQEPAFGSSFTFSPKNNGPQWVEAEAQLPDGRRVFATATFSADSPDLVWFDDALPTGAAGGAEGGDSWKWVTASPAPKSGTKSHESSLAAGPHQHYFSGAGATLDIAAGDVLYTWVYLDPANPPAEIMLQWSDGSWDHRAYWGANLLSYGADGTPSRRYMGPLPATGQWVQLKVPASQVGLEGSTLTGMAFTLHGGRAWWDASGRLSSKAVVSVSATGDASRIYAEPGTFTLRREGDTSADLEVSYSLAGTAVDGVDYQVAPAVKPKVIIPAGAESAIINVLPMTSSNIVGGQSVLLALSPATNYLVGNPGAAAMVLSGNTVPANLHITQAGASLTWKGILNKGYQIAFKNKVTDPAWIKAAFVTATNSICSWVDPESARNKERYYLVAQVD